MSVTRIPAWNEIAVDENQTSTNNSPFRQNVKKYYKSAMHTLTTMLDFSILASPSFLVLTCSGFLTLLGFFVPFMYISGNTMHILLSHLYIYMDFLKKFSQKKPYIWVWTEIWLCG